MNYMADDEMAPENELTLVGAELDLAVTEGLDLEKKKDRKHAKSKKHHKKGRKHHKKKRVPK